MAGPNASEIRVAGSGRVLVAPKNTAAPADSTKAWPEEWTELGYTTVDGVKFAKDDKFEEVEAWQSVAPIRYAFKERVLSAEFALLQINTDTLPFFFGGATVTQDAAGGQRIEVSAAPHPDERALGIEFIDGPDVTQRFVIPRGIVTENEDVELTRTTALQLGVTFTALAPDKSASDPLMFWQLSPPSAPAAEAGTGRSTKSSDSTAEEDQA